MLAPVGGNVGHGNLPFKEASWQNPTTRSANYVEPELAKSNQSANYVEPFWRGV